jgi:hypothetical protein
MMPSAFGASRLIPYCGFCIDKESGKRNWTRKIARNDRKFGMVYLKNKLRRRGKGVWGCLNSCLK